MIRHSRTGQSTHGAPDSLPIEVKSKFDAEFRRFSITRKGCPKFEDLFRLVERLHQLEKTPFTLCYSDPKDGDLLPINNDDNYAKALEKTRTTVLRLLIQRKAGESTEELNGSILGGKPSTWSKVSQLIPGATPKGKPHISISYPEDFRQVSAIIDVDIVPDTCRRVRLLKHGSDKPLGFYIRDGTSVRVTPHGLEKVPGIFISRLVPGGLAESTGLLAVNDEVLEVNGIEVAGKTLDQVTDMMVANSANLIITVKPANQRGLLGRGGVNRNSQLSAASAASQVSTGTNSDDTDDRYDQDEIREFTPKAPQEDNVMTF